jgi:hypothetical protein
MSSIGTAMRWQVSASQAASRSASLVMGFVAARHQLAAHQQALGLLVVGKADAPVGDRPVRERADVELEQRAPVQRAVQRPRTRCACAPTGRPAAARSALDIRLRRERARGQAQRTPVVVPGEDHDVAAARRPRPPTRHRRIWSGWMWPTLPGLRPMIVSQVLTRGRPGSCPAR